MTAPQTWRDKQAARLNPVAEAVRAFEDASGTMQQRMIMALDAARQVAIIARQCDEPGCKREASCGFEVDGGYRRTCYEHSRWAKL